MLVSSGIHRSSCVGTVLAVAIRIGDFRGPTGNVFGGTVEFTGGAGDFVGGGMGVLHRIDGDLTCGER